MPDQKAKTGLRPRDLRDVALIHVFQCGETSLLADGPNSKGICKLACNLWTCDECGPTKLAGLRKLIHAGEPTHMLTLTERPSARMTAAEQAQEQTKAWKKFYARLIRHLKLKGIAYCWHREAQKNGTSHLHILMRLPVELKKTWIADTWKELTGSFKVDLTTISDQGGIAQYVTKHTAKEPAKFGNCKRYFATRDWDLRKDQEGEPFPDVGALYLLVQQSAAKLQHKYLCLGYRADHTRHPRVVVMESGP
jgi:hypothetical protein